MADVSDIELLRNYTRQNVEDAFAELVQRPGQAEEITQAVFIIKP
jgi:hypothetical protein